MKELEFENCPQIVSISAMVILNSQCCFLESAKKEKKDFVCDITQAKKGSVSDTLAKKI